MTLETLTQVPMTEETNVPPPTTPPHPPSSSKSLLSTTPTETLRARTKRISIVSGITDFELDHDNPDGREVGKDGRIEEWLEQQCGGFITWENKEKENMSGKERFLRHKESSRTLLTTNSVTTRTTSTCFSSESDPLFPSPTAASSVTGPSTSNQCLQPPCGIYPPTPRPRSDDPEVARADSPLLGYTVNEITADATYTGSLVANTDGKDMDIDKVTDVFFSLALTKFADCFLSV